MSKSAKIKLIKRIIKIAIATVVLLSLILLGFFVKHNHNFENSDVNKWLVLSEDEQKSTVSRVIPDYDDSDDLLIQCVTKIANLPDSEKMSVRDAIVICYNGIKMVSAEKDEK